MLEQVSNARVQLASPENIGMLLNAENTIMPSGEGHIQVDDRFIRTLHGELNGLADIMQARLNFNVGGIGTLLSKYKQISRTEGYHVSMTDTVLPENKKLTFNEAAVPLPLISGGFDVHARTTAAYQKNGYSPVTELLAEQGRIIGEAMERMLFQGYPDFEYLGYGIDGYLTKPGRKTIGLTDWDNANTRDIHGDVLKMLRMLEEAHRPSPFIMYMSDQDYAILRQLFYPGQVSSTTQRDMILAHPEISAIRSSMFVPKGNVLLVSLTESVVDLAVGQDVTVNSWQHPSGFHTSYMVWGIQVPRIKHDINGDVGIVHGSW